MADIGRGFRCTRLRAVMAAGIGDETFRECGWRKVRHTVIRAVPVHETPGPAPDPRLHILPDDQSTAIWSDWVEAHWRHYQATHTDNPPVLPSGGPRALFLGDDLEAGNAVALIEAGRVVGFASLRAVAGECAESGWIAAPGIREGMATLWHWMMRRARALGVSVIELEADDSDPDLWALCATLSAERETRYVIWETRIEESRV
ncbi:MAG: hypothetical protein P8X43_12290 [Maritimibacter sp.]